MSTREFFLSIAVLIGISAALPHLCVADHSGEQKRLKYNEALAGDDDSDRRHRQRNREGGGDQESRRNQRELDPVNQPNYKEHCGACHFAYQPGLLPSESWRKILDGTEGHFGESFELDPATKESIFTYLEKNAAERSSAKRSVKIMRSLGNRTPLRITEIPYILDKHHSISASVLKRQSIGSLANCAACHRRAEEGVYDDHDVAIPR